MSISGLHIIGELKGCELSRFPESEGRMAELRIALSELLVRAGLRELGSYYHFFGPRAVTATLCLAESHLTFHTWPEVRAVTVDVFVCNLNSDNTTAARLVYQNLVQEIFQAETVNTTEINRSI